MPKPLHSRLQTLMPLEQHHARILAEIHGESFSKAWNLQIFSDFIKNGAGGFLGLQGGQAEGFIIFRKTLDEAEILTLAVRPKARNLGLASGLVSGMIEDLRDCGVRVVFLEVAVNNIPALALYEKYGFVAKAKRLSYYEKEGALVDGWLLACDIHDT